MKMNRSNQYCTLCREHGELFPKRSHKGTCPYEDDSHTKTCGRCRAAIHRRDNKRAVTKMSRDRQKNNMQRLLPECVKSLQSIIITVPDANGVHHEVKMVPSEYIGPVNVVDVDEKEREIDTNCIYLVNIVFDEAKTQNGNSPAVIDQKVANVEGRRFFDLSQIKNHDNIDIMSSSSSSSSGFEK